MTIDGRYVHGDKRAANAQCRGRVSTRMLPVLATWEAMKLTVSWTRLINAEFDVLFGS